MDKDNLEAIAGRYLDSVYRVAVNYCKNTENAADAVQNAFLKLMTTDTAFADDEHVHRWLLRVTINECKGFWRSFWHRNVVSLDALCEESRTGTAESRCASCGKRSRNCPQNTALCCICITKKATAWTRLPKSSGFLRKMCPCGCTADGRN